MSETEENVLLSERDLVEAWRYAIEWEPELEPEKATGARDTIAALLSHIRALEAASANPFDRACCARERAACADIAQETEERGWGRKGYHPVANAIRGRGSWIAYLSGQANQHRSATPK